MTIGKKKLAIMIGAAFMCMAAASICMVSCGNKKVENETANATDSTAVTQQEEVQEEEVKSVLETPDLAIFNLKGNVKTVKVTGVYNDNKRTLMEINYDEQGRLTRLDEYKIAYDKVESGKVTNKKGNKVKRDKNGRITAIDCADGCSGEQGYHFEYGKNKMSYTIDYGECSGMYTEEIITGQDGMETSATCTVNDEYMSWTLNQNYTDTKLDRYGNWIERKVKWESIEEEYNETEEGEQNNNVNKTNGSFTQTRKIEYYE